MNNPAVFVNEVKNVYEMLLENHAIPEEKGTSSNARTNAGLRGKNWIK
jgi:hypothetical protein